jgi:hypothetical protein
MESYRSRRGLSNACPRNTRNTRKEGSAFSVDALSHQRFTPGGAGQVQTAPRSPQSMRVCPAGCRRFPNPPTLQLPTLRPVHRASPCLGSTQDVERRPTAVVSLRISQKVGRTHRRAYEGQVGSLLTGTRSPRPLSFSLVAFAMAITVAAVRSERRTPRSNAQSAFHPPPLRCAHIDCRQPGMREVDPGRYDGW